MACSHRATRRGVANTITEPEPMATAALARTPVASGGAVADAGDDAQKQDFLLLDD